ncbi:putative sulfurtransferase [Helianthus annuus]|nr:putative sulfurtransferase [Helianthus annuus]
MASKIIASTVRRSLSPKLLPLIRPLSTAAAAAAPAEPYDTSAGISMKGVKISGRPLYLDMQATSPVDPRVLDAMLPYFVSQYGNPHSRTHLYGWESDEAVEAARAQVASLINASPKEIVFTSGATECNNISVKGVMHFYKEKKKHVITTQTEHKCVLDSCRHLQQEGFDVTYLPVKSDGLIDLNDLRNSIRSDTGLVSVMAVNNEIGVIQPMEEIGEICKEFGVPFHTDAAQALGKIPVDVNKWNVAVSSGSACTSASLEPSYVLRALGVDEDMAHTSIRFGIGRFTTEEEIDKAIELTVNQVEKLREMSPLYEMVKEGIDIKSIQWSQH